jgi:Sugar-transfer associated ATP-grasp
MPATPPRQSGMDVRPAEARFGVRGGEVATPGLSDVLHADIGSLRRGFSRPEARASLLFRFLRGLLDEKRGRRYQMRIVYCPPLPLLWSFLPGDGSVSSFLHHFYYREIWRERSPWARARLLAGMLVWPFVTLGTAAWFTWLNGAAIRRRCGKRSARQMGEEIYLAARYGVLPPWYYIFELFDEGKRRRAGHYLHRFETKGGIYRFLKRAPRGAARTPLGNKLHFAAWCRAHDIACAPALFAVADGEPLPEFSQNPFDESQLPALDLFVKPAEGRGGFGAERWCCDGQGSYQNGAATLSAKDLLQHIRRQSRLEACIVQPRLTNHADMAGLSNGVLSTVRLMTIENERGEFEPTHAMLRMAVGKDSTVDNFHAGGIAAKVDLQTGTLAAATDIGLRPDMGWRERHPDTQAQIAGRALPFWSETLDLVARAHAAFPDRVLIGWDVAILQDGPVIIEGNSGPDVDIIERTHGEPLGESRFAELLAFHLRRAIEDRREVSRGT